jgi:hypothetical protein
MPGMSGDMPGISVGYLCLWLLVQAELRSGDLG